MKNNWIKVDIVCVKQDSNRHSLKDEDVYIETQYVRNSTVMAIFNADAKYWPPMSKGCIVTPMNTLPTVHDVEELIEMFKDE